MNHIAAKQPEHTATYQQLRGLILFGNLVPGQAVTIQGLAETLQAGMTPVREAIRRLTAEGALVEGLNRRVTVPEITRDALEQIQFARLAVEPKLASKAAQNMTDGCLEDLLKIDREVDLAIERGDINSYLEFNFRFHFRLYDQANAQVLSKIAASLWLQIGPSLRIVCGRYGTANLPDKHSETIAALRAGQTEAAGQAIADDISQGMGQIRLSLEP